MSTTNVNDFLRAGGAPSASFPTIGTTVKGTIVASEVTQQTEFKSNALKFWDDAKTQPMMQAVITLQTDERDPSDPTDTGLRKLYVKGQMQAAVRDALKGADLELGGLLAVQFTSEEPSKQAGANPKKIYVAQYRPPATSTAATNDLLGGSPSAPSTQPAAADLI